MLSICFTINHNTLHITTLGHSEMILTNALMTGRTNDPEETSQSKQQYLHFLRHKRKIYKGAVNVR